MKIDRDAMGKYHISIGTGKIYRADNLMEVGVALEHYYRDIISNTDEDFSVSEHEGNVKRFDNCPLCRG